MLYCSVRYCSGQYNAAEYSNVEYNTMQRSCRQVVRSTLYHGARQGKAVVMCLLSAGVALLRNAFVTLESAVRNAKIVCEDGTLLLFASVTEQGLGITMKCNVTKKIFDSTVRPCQGPPAFC